MKSLVVPMFAVCLFEVLVQIVIVYNFVDDRFGVKIVFGRMPLKKLDIFFIYNIGYFI
jgi:hypothetical protein